jgi:two-component system chemotaxis sensor kinase CheA
VTLRDPELTRILLQELERHLAVLVGLLERRDDADEACKEAVRTVHALKGSAGLGGEPELANAMARLERRLRGGEHEALGETIEVVRRAVVRLALGDGAAMTVWPVPPPDLVAGVVDPDVRAAYVAEVTDRLARIDDCIAATDDSEAVAAEIYRHVHTLKGAASAAGDDAMAWFCHGLEEQIRRGTSGSTDAANAAIEEVASWRSILGTMLDDSDAALATLRGLPARSRTRTGTQRPSVRPGDEARNVGDTTIRVSAEGVDSLLDHASGVAVARERVAASVDRTAAYARQVRRLRVELTDALRAIGPPRPWGAPAAALRKIERTSQSLGQIGDHLDTVAERLKLSDQSLKDDAVAAKKLLTKMRQTPIRGMFTRLATAAHAEARRMGRMLVVRTLGAEELIDRRLVEALLEPCMQLARNAIAHGIELPEQRTELGKPREATLTFAAHRSGNRLSVSIGDDGAGVDVAAVRARAVETGVVTEVLAEAADDQTLLELLFLPGFSTRGQSPDLLAGRGIGLDITLASVQRLGGTIRLASRHGLGFEARLDVPIESGLATVLWVDAEGVELAIPAANARRVRRHEDVEGAERVPHLAACLEPRLAPRPTYVVDLDGLDATEPFSVGVNAVGVTEEVLVRQLSPLVWGVGPYAGAIVRGDGSIRLALDIRALAPRARALGRVPEGRISEPPSRPPPASRQSTRS